MTLFTYLVRVILRPLGIILGVLMALFASYAVTQLTADAANGLLPGVEIARLVGLKLLIALEVLLPASLYLAVILSVSRLHQDSEHAAMLSLRRSPMVVAAAALGVALPMGLVVAILSLQLRPWAYHALHMFSDRAADLVDLQVMQPGTFYVGHDGSRVIYLAHREPGAAEARDVFVRLAYPDHVEIVSARLAYPVPPKLPGQHLDASLRDAYIYELDRKGGAPDTVLQAEGITVDPNTAAHAAALDSNPVATPTAQLLRASDAASIAELQWRFSTPIATVLLGLLAVPLSRSRPRGGRAPLLAAALIIYFAYYLASTSTRSWTQHGQIPTIPGAWWAPLLLAVVVASLVPDPSIWRGKPRARA